ncbi:MAG: ATP-dependent Clp protease adaptor ClpS [Bacteroidota bacterium]|nr:ATP-dependent Clp protease adaptor ClpS [Bacteroidota bacterium]MDP4234774.1 ATP-dependent Clp protease adaptor ClpS [Bacteroidota bacterium]MDP4244146.1 ATP-dependent Clp protease adaptor ClpS [Bacteroidota bacterium]MDP4289298.1 ATP-dependent Clp protease adaptor ClpS [Bacteroidota bacterium]
MLRDLASKLWPLKFSSNVTPPKATSLTTPEIGFLEDSEIEQGLAARVLLYNDSYHSFDEVGMQLAKALGCSVDEGEAIAWRVHATGQAIVFDGDLMGCLHVSAILEEIALNTQVMT